MDWDKLKVFYSVAQVGSFTRAAEQLNLSQSAISRQISGLEETLGAPLFYRHARGLIMTEQGDLLYDTVRDVFLRLALTEAMINETKGAPQGPLKVTTSVGFGSLWLTPRLGEFLETYPNISLKVILSDEPLDLHNREADISLTQEPPHQPGLLTVPLPPYRLRIYGSREYFEKHGVPTKPEDLDQHRLIVYGDDSRHMNTKINWILHVGAKRGHVRKPYLIVNNVHAICQAVRAGIGLAALHRYVVGDDASLVEVLPDLPGGNMQRYIVYPQQLSHSKRVRAFREFLEKKALEDQHTL
ncbi:MAG: LysR family transcriptional regulator [Alphaproteobacteria bacterium]|nr:LysR family transcriptional regulator [Alphaproteobacteria bacterium]